MVLIIEVLVYRKFNMSILKDVLSGKLF